MRLVLDIQCLQSESRLRGIGRYAMGLTLAIARSMDEPDDELFLFINESMSDSALALRTELATVVPAARIRGFYSVGATSGNSAENHERRGVSEVIRESALSALRPDAVLVMSLFEGYGSAAISSIRGFVEQLPTATILYDLIPLMSPEHYLAHQPIREWYDLKLAALRNADLLLTISETARQQATNLLVVPDERMLVIGTGLDDRFKQSDRSTESWESTSQRFGITGKVLLYAGGVDRRKNLDLLIQAYGGLHPGLRAGRQLVLVGHCPLGDSRHLQATAASSGLETDEVIIAGYVPDEELLAFYQNCELFVFPSTNEGFGLPALEAMSCGAAVLAVDTPAMRELQKRPDLLVGQGVDAFRGALERTLSDPERIEALRYPRDELLARFDWSRVARNALAGLRKLAAQRGPTASSDALLDKALPRLAVVAPLPPASSGIADYCAELIPSLQAYYSVELIVDQIDVDTSWIPEWIPLRSLQWFEQYGNDFDRVLYHIGNSPFHAHMVDLLERYPGVVVLHDFFLADLQLWRQNQPGHVPSLDRAIAHGHGPAGQLLAHEAGQDIARSRLPCNLEFLELADAVVVHSEHAAWLARHWYGSTIGRKHVAIPFPRSLARLPERHHARVLLGIEPHEILICSFGMLAPHKLNHLMLDAWDLLAAPLRSLTRMTFVGANMPGVYGTAIAARSAAEGDRRIQITGHVSLDEYRTYLAAADIVVQLRGASRGETSAAVFDALGAGVALIVNDHGSLAELPSEVVVKLPELCTAQELSTAIVALVDDVPRRVTLGRAGRQLVQERHDPTVVARHYAMAIESGRRYSPRRHANRLERFVVDWSKAAPRAPWQMGAMARSVALANGVAIKPRLFVDVTAVAALDLRTGIQRVVRALLLQVLRHEPDGYRIEPIYADVECRVYRYAGRYLSSLLGNTSTELEEEVVDTQPGDIFFGLDLAGEAVTLLPDWFRVQSERGVRIVFVAYDLLPVKLPEYFPAGMDLAFRQWLHTIGKIADQVLCISDAVAHDLIDWLDEHQPIRKRPLMIGSFHLGADLGASAPTRGIPPEAESLLTSIQSRPSFLMVGTVEPRKGHEQVVDAFGLLWERGVDVGLVIVGKSGWMMESVLTKVTSHPELGKRLFWLERISDEFLDRIYPACTALIAASRGEGFGLPLIESAQHGLPIIARDLPVFREVAGDHATYFTGTDAESLATAITAWIERAARGEVPSTDGIAFYSWEESGRQAMQQLFSKEGQRVWQGHAAIEIGETLRFDSAKLNWEGWSSIEAEHRWSDGKRMRIGFPFPRGSAVPTRIEILAGTYDVQKVMIFMNEVPVFDGTAALADAILTIDLPRDSVLLGEQNWLEFRVPNARRPGGTDFRQLGIYVKSIRFD